MTDDNKLNIDRFMELSEMHSSEPDFLAKAKAVVPLTPIDVSLEFRLANECFNMTKQTQKDF